MDLAELRKIKNFSYIGPLSRLLHDGIASALARWDSLRGSLGMLAIAFRSLPVEEMSVSGLSVYARNCKKNVRSTLCLDRHGGNTPFEAWQAFGLYNSIRNQRAPPQEARTDSLVFFKKKDLAQARPDPGWPAGWLAGWPAAPPRRLERIPSLS